MAQREQREDERYEREIKARAERYELFLKQVTGFPPIVLSPTSTPISITNSPISITKNDDATTEEEVNDPPVNNIRNDAATTIEEAEEEPQQTRHTQSNDPTTIAKD